MTPRTQRILKAIEREERKRATREAKPERAVPHEVRA